MTATCVPLSVVTPGVAAVDDNDERVKKMLSRYVVRGVGEPTDPARTVSFVASDADGWIAGQTYPVKGGYGFAV